MTRELLAKVVDSLPYPVEVFDMDGTAIYVNKTILEENHIPDPNMVIGKYNIFKDPAIVNSDYYHMVKRAFKGERIFLYDIKVPLESVIKRYGIKDLDLRAVYQDISLFPLYDEMNRIEYIVAFFINRRVYKGKNEIETAKEYMENHWMDEYDADEIAKAAYLSKAHFLKIFKKHIGITPYEYYINYKIRKLREKLLDTNLTIAQAFAECSISYNGHFIKVFKKKVGVTPSAYRKILCK